MIHLWYLWFLYLPSFHRHLWSRVFKSQQGFGSLQFCAVFLEACWSIWRQRSSKTLIYSAGLIDSHCCSDQFHFTHHYVSINIILLFPQTNACLFLSFVFFYRNVSHLSIQHLFRLDYNHYSLFYMMIILSVTPCVRICDGNVFHNLF